MPLQQGIDLTKDIMAIQRLKEAAEKAKIELSSSLQVFKVSHICPSCMIAVVFVLYPLKNDSFLHVYQFPFASQTCTNVITGSWEEAHQCHKWALETIITCHQGKWHYIQCLGNFRGKSRNFIFVHTWEP